MGSGNIKMKKNQQDDAIFRSRIRELAAASAARECCFFTDFLNPAEQSAVLEMEKSLPVPVSFAGGYAQAERVMARLGSADVPGREPEPPIVILQISPLQEKYSDALTHRDFLGSVTGLGIDRKLTGDILTDGKSAWVFTAERIAPFIEDTLVQVKHTNVRVVRTDQVPDGILREPEQIFLVVPSLRLDAVAAKAFGLSRKEVLSLLSAEKVFVNSRLQTKATYTLRENDLISLRGYGRMRYLGTVSDTRKGNLRICAARY